MSLFEYCYGLLRPYQKEIVDKAIHKPKNAIILDVGYGKTLISLCLAIKHYEATGRPALFICSKTLITNVVQEINKFLGDSMKYQILQASYLTPSFRLEPDTMLAITTPDFTAKAYKDLRIESLMANYVQTKTSKLQSTVLNYIIPDVPFISGSDAKSTIYSTNWSFMVVDEAQEYNNITTARCRSIISICASNRSLLSGTIVNEPKTERIFGMYMMIHAAPVLTLPDFSKYISSKDYKGFREICIQADNLEPNDVEYETFVINHTLTSAEKDVYNIFKRVIHNIDEELDDDQHEEKIEFNAEMLVIITQLRKTVLLPLMTLSYIYDAIESVDKSSSLVGIYQKEMGGKNFEKFIYDPGSLRSSRVDAIMNVIDEKVSEKVIVFSTFSSFLNVLKNFITKRPVFLLESTMDTKMRMNIIDRWRESENGVILMTYKLGGAGLNLQDGSIVILSDLWWNDATTKQAVGRVVRKGQKKKCLIYSFYSGVGIEDAIYQKHDDKTDVINALFNGSTDKKVRTLKMEEIIKTI